MNWGHFCLNGRCILSEMTSAQADYFHPIQLCLFNHLMERTANIPEGPEMSIRKNKSWAQGMERDQLDQRPLTLFIGFLAQAFQLFINSMKRSIEMKQNSFLLGSVLVKSNLSAPFHSVSHVLAF